MPGVSGQMPSEEEAGIIRNQIKEYVLQHPDAFLPEDVERLMREDYYLARFFLHAAEEPGDDQIECTTKKIKTSFEWRKSVNPAAIKPEDLDPIVKDAGCMFVKGYDVDGKPIIVLAIRHGPRNVSKEVGRKYFHYIMEKINRETPDGISSVMFECEGAGLKHFDVEEVQYLISTFKNWYPYALNYIFVFDMPWVLNAAWKLVKGWLPPAGQQKTKFLNRTTIRDFIPMEQLLVRWGGTIEWEYTFEETAGPVQYRASNNALALQNSFSSTPGKSVRFDGTQATANSDSFAKSQLNDSSISSPTLNGAKQGGGLLSINPSEEVVFESIGTGSNVNLVATVGLRNSSPDKLIAFKIKTTNPEKYKVRPCLVALNVGEMCEVKIIATSPHLHFNPDVVDSTGKQAFTEDTIRSILKDKFLVTATTLKQEASDEKPSYSELTELMRTCVPEAQYRLRCRIADVQLPANGKLLMGDRHHSQPEKIPSSASSTLASANKQLESLISKVSRLDASTIELQDSLSSMKKLVVLLLLIILGLQVLIYSRLPVSIGEEAQDFGPVIVSKEL